MAAALEVNVLGRSVAVHVDGKAATAVHLHEVLFALQEELELKQQAFDIFDSAGNPLCSDASLRDAVREQRVPLSASLSATPSKSSTVSSDFAVSQALLSAMPSKSSTVSSDFAASQALPAIVESKVLQTGEEEHKPQGSSMDTASTTSHLSASEKSSRLLHDCVDWESMRAELLVEVDAAKGEITRKLNEKSIALEQMISTERATRERAEELFNASLRALREAIDNCTISATRLMTQVEGIKSKLEAASVKHTRLEATHLLDVQSLHDKVEVASTAVPSIKRECMTYCEEAVAALQAQGASLVAAEVSRSSSQAQLSALADKIADLEATFATAEEDRCSNVDAKNIHGDLQAGGLGMESILLGRSEQEQTVSELAERWEEKLQQVQRSLDQMWEQERQRRDVELKDWRAACDQERRERDAEMSNWREAMLSLRAGVRSQRPEDMVAETRPVSLGGRCGSRSPERPNTSISVEPGFAGNRVCILERRSPSPERLIISKGEMRPNSPIAAYAHRPPKASESVASSDVLRPPGPSGQFSPGIPMRTPSPERPDQQPGSMRSPAVPPPRRTPSPEGALRQLERAGQDAPPARVQMWAQVGSNPVQVRNVKAVVSGQAADVQVVSRAPIVHENVPLNMRRTLPPRLGAQPQVQQASGSRLLPMGSPPGLSSGERGSPPVPPMRSLVPNPSLALNPGPPHSQSFVPIIRSPSQPELPRSGAPVTEVMCDNSERPLMSGVAPTPDRPMLSGAAWPGVPGKPSAQ